MPLAALGAADIKLCAAAMEPAAGRATRGSLPTLQQQEGAAARPPRRVLGAPRRIVFVYEGKDETDKELLRYQCSKMSFDVLKDYLGYLGVAFA